ncbi:MAG TPA: SRPBCC domain-containing protein [Candidatus Agrococcus pullicola]|uniref:SRPBCC domain-containing protein n=1 Tax=Candidatus Agrococcus pullicola TaxID=2838429 RepID=A0A9D2CA59_9MICO|nr:SRPBCC domain-containing protein [Candidatus Agrococcus pullicola]
MSKKFEIEKVVALEATLEQVWRAIATPEGQAAWSPDPYASQEGMQVESDEPARLAVRTPEAENAAFHAFEYLIEAHDGGTTTLRFVHSGYLGDDWDADFDYGELTGYGWDMYLHTLAQYCAHFADRPAAFVVAEGPPTSATEGAWASLERALGVDGPVEIGQHLTLHPDGLPKLDGVVDYIQPGFNFIGLRTANGLYRFHDNSVMGMPIAIGHYIYEDVDRERTEQAWKDWLDRVFA